MKLIIVSGLSGAGRTQAIRFFEDYGYFCVDNMPPALIPKFAELCGATDKKIENIAIVVDIRGREFFNDLFKSLKSVTEMGYKYEILFLEASDQALIKRYKETRRNHPLAPNDRLITGIREERKLLAEVKQRATHVIDTSNLLTRQLKEELQKIYVTGEEFEGMIINVVSFGFKYGLPIDADLVFDVRFLPNPYYIEELKRFSGNDDAVKNYVMKWDVTKEFIKKTSELLEFLIPNYIKEGKSQLVIAIGCTGGRHRSVAIANALYESLKINGHTTLISHRDLNLDGAGDAKR
jgi:UPF0042 nucleotide-binding protein